MSFLNPGAFLLLLLFPVIILLYLLKLRRDEKAVSSVYLWRKMVRDMQANAPWQRLQRNLLLFLQLLVLASLILAAVRPFTYKSGLSGKSVVLIFDTSASMSATDVPPNRIEAAKREALQLVEGLENGSTVTVISADDQPRTLISMSSDQRAIRQAFDQVKAGAGNSNLASALQIAAAIALRQPDTHSVVFSDGHADLPNQMSMPGRFSYIPIGSSQENQAISFLSLTVDPSNSSLTCFASVANYGSLSAARRLAFYADGVLISASDLEIPPAGETSIVVGDIISATNVVEARLLPSNVSDDFLPLDDHAFALAPHGEPVRISLVGEGNLFLETALHLIPGALLEVKKPTEPPHPDSDLIVYDGLVPDQDDIPSGSLLFIAPPSDTPYFTVTGLLKNPLPKAVEPQDPAFEEIDLSGINILDAVDITPPLWAKSIIENSSSPNPRPPLLMVGELDGRRIAVLAFSLKRSDLPLQVAFPILISNLVSWLAPGISGAMPETISPGMPLKIPGPLRTGEPGKPLSVTKPDGTILQVDGGSGDLLFADTDQIGVYWMKSADGATSPFAVNLFSPSESRISVQETLPIVGSGVNQSRAESQLVKHEYWRLAAILGILLLILEWLVYYQTSLLSLLRRFSSNFRKLNKAI